MATDVRAGILTKEEYLDNAQVMYSPVILALTNTEFHNFDYSQVKFKEVNVDKDSIVAQILTKEATEKAHIKARGMEKSFNVFAKGAKFIKSLREPSAIPNLQKVHNKVLREYMIMFDKDGLHGDGGNNGLLSSADPFYITKNSHQVSGQTDFAKVQDLNSVMNDLKLQVSETTSSSDVIVYVYGKDLISYMATITQDNETAVRDILKKTYPEAMFVEVPLIATEQADGNGFVVVSRDATTLHLTTEPTIYNQGENAEDEYYYANYMTGSLQVTPDLEGAVIKQPITFA